MRPAGEAALAVANGGRDLLLLYGDPGLGKTHLAWAAVRHSRERGFPAILWGVPEFLAFLRSSYDGEATESVDSKVRTYSSPDFLLVLDDLGVHNATAWTEEQLYRILNRRYENEAPTIITANVGIEKIDPRIQDRFLSGVVFCEGKSQR
ncbi:hypothetical protein LCGC14_2840860 [marine sediment metagenome]|uniref:IstB-like ATP-binding domain-containing protein n=1 Tax=marine sediment metagenome TaxID=412755 RepID=A0A0F8YB51_9ZZZZ